MKKYFLSIILVVIHHFVFAQTPFGDNIHWLSGYQKEISGETIGYFSAFPDYVNEALLTRATDGKKPIEWLTSTVPSNNHSPYIYFRWVAAHSSGTSSGNRNFDFYINDEKVLTITTLPVNKKPDWSFTTSDSTKIVFVQLKRDASQDSHGIIYLRVPASRIKPGAPLRLKIIGEDQQSNDWFMTFKYAFEEKADIASLPFLLKDGRQVLMLNVLHFGKEEKLDVTVNKTHHFSFQLKNGMNTFDVPVNAVSKKDSVLVWAKYADTVLSNGFVKIEPVIKREIDFIPHSHTDIGYSNLQTEVEKIHIKNIYDALRMIQKTKDYPDAARFKWNVESLWAAENFLKQASQKDSLAFFNAVKNGSIGLSGFYANMMTELSTPEEVFHYTDYAKILRDKFHLPIESAMITDVPGVAWSTVTGFAKGGIKYFSDGPNYLGKNNPYEGDRVGYFVKAWGDKPVWWQSRSGQEKILFWTAGHGYSSWHGNSPGAIFYSGAKKIAAYMNELAAEHYAYEIIQWRYNIVSDNGPIDTTISDFVKQWNEKYASPKIVLNTVTNLFEKFEKRYGKIIPVVKGDISPYWMDGAASTAREEGRNRENSFRLQQLTTLYSMISPKKYNPQNFYEAWRNIIMFTEHTWGAFNSISDPDLPFVKEQWRIKKDFMLNANNEIDSLSNELLQPIVDSTSRKIAVVNTLSWKRTGAVYLPKNIDVDFIKDENGKTFPLQKLSDGRKVFIAENLQPISVSYFYITNNKIKNDHKSPFTVTDSSLSNGKIFIQWNTTNGSISKLEKDRFNFAANFKNQGLNSYWYVPGRDPSEAVTNDKVKISLEENGLYQITIAIHSSAAGTFGLTRRITLLANDDKILLENTIDKKDVRTKEGVYFSFPFAQNLQKTTMDVGYGTMAYLKDQLPGSNMDFVSPHRWLDASDNMKGIQLMMIEPFMLAPDSMVDERLLLEGSFKKWKDKGTKTSTWFSYVMNNYWHTNFKIDQDSIATFHYALRLHDTLKNGEQEKAAMEFTQPLIVFQVKESVKLPQNQFKLSNEKIVITSITPQSGGFMIRIFNPENSVQTTSFLWNVFKPSEKIPEIKLVPFEVKEILVK
jgi:alpha-mannosidase